jgi:c-di-GMP-binding flagellar brake protein YcgR
VQDDAGGQIRWPRGTRVKVNFWRESDAGYAFESKVLGYDKVKGNQCVLVHHARTLKREQQRKYRRSPIHRPCFFFPVLIVDSGTGRRAGKKAVVQTIRRYLGNLIDISAGGCSINSIYPLKPGNLCKIEFELARRQRITVFGKVKRVRKTGFRGGVMHIMFTKLSSHYLNQIYLYVYDFSPPRTPIAAR